MIDVTIVKEYGHDIALVGLGLSYGKPADEGVAMKCVRRGDSHAKFLESIAVWLDITAPRYWWQQFDTYRVGVSKQSESTMHTIMRGVDEDDFAIPIPVEWLALLNELIKQGQFSMVNALLPEGFLQRRIAITNYKTLAHIYDQRRNHRLSEWQTFCDSVIEQLEHPEYILEYGVHP